MHFRLLFTHEASSQLELLQTDKGLSKRHRAVCTALGRLETNPRHPSLNTHKYSSLSGKNGEEIFDAYAENKTPAAYRIFWHYGPGKSVITIVAITAHP